MYQLYRGALIPITYPWPITSPHDNAPRSHLPVPLNQHNQKHKKRVALKNLRQSGKNTVPAGEFRITSRTAGNSRNVIMLAATLTNIHYHTGIGRITAGAKHYYHWCMDSMSPFIPFSASQLNDRDWTSPNHRSHHVLGWPVILVPTAGLPKRYSDQSQRNQHRFGFFI